MSMSASTGGRSFSFAALLLALFLSSASSAHLFYLGRFTFQRSGMRSGSTVRPVVLDCFVDAGGLGDAGLPGSREMFGPHVFTPPLPGEVMGRPLYTDSGRPHRIRHRLAPPGHEGEQGWFMTREWERLSYGIPHRQRLFTYLLHTAHPPGTLNSDLLLCFEVPDASADTHDPAGGAHV